MRRPRTAALDCPRDHCRDVAGAEDVAIETCAGLVLDSNDA
jgi:hypothetical protein